MQPAAHHHQTTSHRQTLRAAAAAAVLAALLGAPACTSKSEFTGGPSQSGKGRLVQECTAAGATSTRLTTATLANGKKGNFLAYELTLTDCDGTPKSISDARIYFDVDGEHGGKESNVTYSLTAGGDSIDGTMDKVVGEDMFGKQGGRFFFFRSSRTASLDAASMPATIRFELAGQRFAPYVDGAVSPSATALNTYLRIGDAASVENTVELR